MQSKTDRNRPSVALEMRENQFAVSGRPKPPLAEIANLSRQKRDKMSLESDQPVYQRVAAACSGPNCLKRVHKRSSPRQIASERVCHRLG